MPLKSLSGSIWRSKPSSLGREPAWVAPRFSLCNTVLTIPVLQELSEAASQFAKARHPQKPRKRSVWRVVQTLCQVWFCGECGFPWVWILAQPFENRCDLSKKHKKTKKRDFFRIFVKAITLWQHLDSRKIKKTWKRVSTVSRAYKNLVSLRSFRDLARVTRPKWWFFIFWKKCFHTA